MNKHKIISELNGVLAIDKRHAESLLLSVFESEGEFKDVELKSETLQSENYLNQNVSGQTKNILCLEITGAIFKRTNWFGIGTNTIAEQIKKANENNFSAIILKIDSYGGNALAVQGLGAAIKESQIPVYAYVGNGMALSAGYWIASFCKEIYATFKTDEVGSIGMFVTYENFKKYYEKLGIEITDVYATKSTDKNKESREADNGNFQPLIERIDFFNEIFLNDVKANRKGIDKEVLSGASYTAKEALELGLIDGIITFENLVQKIFNAVSKKELNAEKITSERARSVVSSAFAEFYFN